MAEKNNFPKRGEIWLLRNPERIKELGKDYRPIVVISNNERNEYSSSVVILSLTTEDLENILPVEVYIENAPKTGLDEPSKILCDSPFTWDKGIRFKKKLGIVSKEIMEKIKVAWKICFKCRRMVVLTKKSNHGTESSQRNSWGNKWTSNYYKKKKLNLNLQTNIFPF